MTPKRIQRKRTKGWRMPPNTLYVGRGSKWGNPFSIDYHIRVMGFSEDEARRECIFKFTECITGRDEPISPDYAKQMDTIKKNIAALRGLNLCCWCPLDQPCHADVLLEIANG